jgi:hypothetical protein
VRILVDNTLLADSALTAGCVGPSGLTINGESIVDEVAFFRAATVSFFERGGESINLQFRVARNFASARLAEKFALMHRGNVPRQGIVTCVVGTSGDTESLYLEGAIVQPAIGSVIGTSVAVQYTIKGGAFTTDVPDDLPDEPDTEDDFVVRRRGSIQLTAADVGKAVTFSSPLEGAPTIVWAWITRSEGGRDIRAIPNKPSYAAEGFECDFTGAIPDNTYYLEYIAIL